MLLALLGCRPDPTGHPPHRTTDPLPTPVAGTADVVSATCAVDADNAVRATCRLALSGVARAEIELTDGVEDAIFRADQAATDPELAIWGLYPASSWTWTARAGGVEQTGTLEVPDALPDRVRFDPGRTTTGRSTVVQWLGALDCDGGGDVAVLDAVGRVRWYQDTGGVDIDMVQLSEAGTVLALADKVLLVEMDLAGRDRLRRDDLDFPIHHDAFRRGDRIYVLSADAWPGDDGRQYVEDQVLALDDAGDVVWTWDEHDWLDTSRSNGVVNSFWDFAFPGAVDAWHTNGIYVTGGGDVLVSLYKESTVLRVSGADGSIQWVLAGDDVGNVLPATLHLVDGGGTAAFGGQHGPVLVGDHLLLFDNDDQRGLELALDRTAHTATRVGDWPLAQPISCPVQGSVYPLPEGHRLVTCADRHLVVEFDERGGAIGGFAPTCPDPKLFPRIPRAQPVDLWAGWSAAGVTATRVH